MQPLEAVPILSCEIRDLCQEDTWEELRQPQDAGLLPCPSSCPSPPGSIRTCSPPIPLAAGPASRLALLHRKGGASTVHVGVWFLAKKGRDRKQLGLLLVQRGIRPAPGQKGKHSWQKHTLLDKLAQESREQGGAPMEDGGCHRISRAE